MCRRLTASSLLQVQEESLWLCPAQPGSSFEVSGKVLQQCSGPSGEWTNSHRILLSKRHSRLWDDDETWRSANIAGELELKMAWGGSLLMGKIRDVSSKVSCQLIYDFLLLVIDMIFNLIIIIKNITTIAFALRFELMGNKQIRLVRHLYRLNMSWLIYHTQF